MNNLCIVPFIGLPASGKTTTALELVKYCSNISFICISYDLFQSKLNLNETDFQSGKYKEFRIFMLKLTERIVAALRSDDFVYSNTKNLLIEHGLDWNYGCTGDVGHTRICIILDDNNYYRSMRYEFYQLAKRYETGFMQIYFKSTLENSIARNFERNLNSQVLETVLCTMNIRLEPPNEKNRWEKYYCTVNIDASGINFQNICQMIVQQIESPEKVNPMPDVSPHIPSSKLHQIDLYLRKLVTQRLRENPTIYHPNDLNEKRKQIMADLRAHIIKIPNHLDEIQEYFVINK